MQQQQSGQVGGCTCCRRGLWVRGVVADETRALQVLTSDGAADILLGCKRMRNVARFGWWLGLTGFCFRSNRGAFSKVFGYGFCRKSG